MAAEGHALTSGEYIVHHLTHLSTGKPKGLVDFSVVNWDSVFFSIAIGAVLGLVARRRFVLGAAGFGVFALLGFGAALSDPSSSPAMMAVCACWRLWKSPRWTSA